MPEKLKTFISLK